MKLKILRLFVNKLTADDKYSLVIRGNLTQPIQMHLSQKQKGFCQLFCQFVKFTSSFELFQKKMTLTAHVFPRLRTPKDVVR